MTILSEIKCLVKNNIFYPKKRLGQNFLIDEKSLHKIIVHSKLSANDVVLEIGSGFGFLTKLLAKQSKKVITVEIDKRLVKFLKHKFRNFENITIIEGDILKIDIPTFNKVVSIPPYYNSSRILFWLLKRKFEYAILTFQEEFAKRLAATSGSNYGRISVTTYNKAEIELLEKIPKKMFWPTPKVDSTILRLIPRKEPILLEDTLYSSCIKAIFSQKNKKVRNSIIPFFRKLKISKIESRKLADTLHFKNKKVRELKFKEIANTIIEIKTILKKETMN